MTNIYNAIQNLYNMDKETWQEVLSEMYTLVNNTSLKFDTFEQKFLLHLGNEVTKELKKMYDDGRLGDLINDVLLNDINTKVDNNYTTLDNKIDTVNSELNSQLDTIANNIQIFVEDFKKLPSDNSDSERIQRAINKAKSYFNSTNEGSESGLYYYNNVDVVFDSRVVYTCSSTVNIPYGVSITAYGKCKIKAPNFDKTVTLFTVNNKRFDSSNFQFIGFKKIYELTGANVDCSIINIINNNFHQCTQAIDTFSYDVSESTMLTIDRCSFNEVDVFLNNFCDKTVIQNSWLYHSGYNGSAIINYNKLEIKNCLGVPKKKSDTSPSWITQKPGKYIACINCDGTRFGAEQGGIPIVINEVPFSTSTINCMTTDLIFENCQLSSASTSSFILKEIPNNIVIRNCYGMYDQTKGFIVTDEGVNVEDVDEKYVNFEIDNKILKSPNYPYVQQNLEKFLLSNKEFNQSTTQNKIYFNELTEKNGNINKAEIITLYTLGANGGYSTGIIELELYTSNGARNCKQKIMVSFQKGTTNNTITGYNKLVVENVYKSHSDMIFEPTITCEIVENKLVIKATGDSNNGCSYFIRGTGIMSYHGSNGVGIIEN